MNSIKHLRILISMTVSIMMLTGCNADLDIIDNNLNTSTQTQPSLARKYHTEKRTDKSADKSADKSTVMKTESNTIVAELSNSVISLKELDASIQLRLFDLEWQKYQLRKNALKVLINQKTQEIKYASQQIEITLTPPKPPRIGLTKDARAIRGQASANIIVDIFCSYQSSHCARLQPTINELEQHYSDQIAFRFFDLPQKYHRAGYAAANAFHCAVEYSQKDQQVWAFQSSLYADINQLNLQRYRVIAEQLGIQSSDFDQCLKEKRYQSKISSDVDFGKQIGLGNVPVVFINGLYIKGANATDLYRYYIDQELQQMGQEIKLQNSSLPIILVATTVSNLTNESSALLSNEAGENIKNYKVGEQIFPLVSIINIQADHIIIDNKGVTERITIKTSKGHQLAQDSSYLISVNDTEAQDLNTHSEYDENLIEKPNERVLPVTGKMTLSRDWLNQQLLDQSELEKHFYKAEHVVEGLHLIKLNNIDNQRFYTSLGLKSGDVIMRVNDQWVHEAQNPLWASLQQNNPVSLVVMRKGLPYRYDYVIE